MTPLPKGYLRHCFSHLLPDPTSCVLCHNLNKYLAQESIGNPTREAETALQVMVNFLNKHLPDIEEVPLAVLIAFTTVPNDQLDVQKSRIPAMHVSKVKGYLKQQWSKSKPMPKGQYEAIQAIFDKASGLGE